jgi:hypothetical protein
MASMPRGRGTFRVEHVNRQISVETPGEFERQNLARISTDLPLKAPRKIAYPEVSMPERRPLPWK